MTGIVPLLKPPGMSSQQAVTHVRTILHAGKAGHAGTLDPGAAGVLPVLVGRATRLSSRLMHAPKEYIAEMLVGLETDTLDTYGRVTASASGRFAAQSLAEILPAFTGEIEQIPPDYAAIKVHGRPLYALAREGKSVTPSARRVVIDELELLRAAPDRFLLRIACRQGTYIRALIRDLAHALGTVAVTSFLLRTRAGGFVTGQTVTFGELEQAGEECLKAPEEALQLETVHLPAYLYPILSGGTPIDPARVPGLKIRAGTDYSIRCRGEYFGIGTLTDAGLKITVRLHES